MSFLFGNIRIKYQYCKSDHCSMSTFTLSAKSIKNYTSKLLNYELTSNAFELLNQHIKSFGERAADINEWLMRVLEEAKEMDMKVIKRKDMETIILNLSVSESMSENESDDIANVSLSENDHGSGTDLVNTSELLDDNKESLEDTHKYNNNLNSDIHDNNVSLNRSAFTTIEVTQLPPMSQSEMIRELEDEIERLKKIIQLILNKQAELA